MGRHVAAGPCSRSGQVAAPVWGRPVLALLFLLGWVGAWPPVAAAAPLPPREADGPAEPAAPQACDPDRVLASGAVYRLCMPLLWNGDLVVYAHGYVPPTRPVGIPEEQMNLPGGIPVSTVVTTLGYAFATTSYRSNGLAVATGVADLVDLVSVFAAAKGMPERVYLAGVSEGGLITTLAVEGHPELFDGGLAMCGPYGNFRAQLDYMADLRITFDYFFPGLMPPDAVTIPSWLIDGWGDHYAVAVRPALEDPANAAKVDQLLRVAGAATDPDDSSTREATIEQLLEYNVLATNDARAKLGGQPFDNQGRIYAGSDDDAALNAGVQRFGADPAALAAIGAHYQTGGRLAAPLVTLHSTADPLVPEWQALLYRDKVTAAGNPELYEYRAVPGYGHCAFGAGDVLSAFWRLVEMVDSLRPHQVARVYLPMAMRGSVAVVR